MHACISFLKGATNDWSAIRCNSTWKSKAGMADEFAKRVRAGALPVMQKMDGFKGYYLIASSDDTITAVSLFTNKSDAETSTQTLMPWIKENLGPLLASPPEAMDGTVILST